MPRMLLMPPWPPWPPPPPRAKASVADRDATVMARAATVAVKMDLIFMFVSSPFRRATIAADDRTLEGAWLTRCASGHKKAVSQFVGRALGAVPALVRPTKSAQMMP